jgi:hypothetical protein
VKSEPSRDTERPTGRPHCVMGAILPSGFRPPSVNRNPVMKSYHRTRHSIHEGDEDDFVSIRLGPIPGSVERDKSTAPVSVREIGCLCRRPNPVARTCAGIRTSGTIARFTRSGCPPLYLGS